MRKIVSLGILVVIISAMSICVAAQDTAAKPAATPATAPNRAYDAELAKKLGADDYGMKGYVMVLLKTGKVKRGDAKTMEPLQIGHLKMITRLADEEKIVVAGPFRNAGDLSGLFIFNVKTIEEAKELVKADPLIAGGYLDAEFHIWYGSAALSDMKTHHKKVQKKSMF